MSNDKEQPWSYQTTSNPNQFEKPHVVSITPPTEDQSPFEKSQGPSSVSTKLLEKRLQVAQNRLQQEDLNNSKNYADQMEAKVGNIEQVRDLLFGGHVRDSDKRFKRLEERVNLDHQKLHEEMSDQLKTLEERINGEIDGLSDAAKLDRQEHQSAVHNLEHELKLTKNEMTNRITQLDDKLSYEIKTLRQQTHKLIQELALQTRQQNDNMTNLLSQELGQLQDEKVNRNDLAAFFNEFAIHLTRNYESGDSSE